MNLTMKNVILLGFHTSLEVKREIEKNDAMSSSQTYNYHSKISSCLMKFCNVRFISSLPVSDYPLYSSFVIRKKEEKIFFDDRVFDVTYIPFINFSVFKVLTRFISAFFYLIKSIYFNENKTDHILVYSVHLPYMFSACLVSWLTGIEIISIWTDPPSVKSPLDSKLKNRLRKFELKASKYLMSKFSKSIVITEALALDFNPKKPWLVVDSIFDMEASASTSTHDSISINEEIVFTYTGTIDRKYGLDIMVEAFMGLKDNVKLQIYGIGCDLDYLLERINSISNISYHGLVTIEEIVEIQKKSDYLLNIRNSEQDFVKYSFPSKITEYINSGKPIISSRLKGIPDEYFSLLIPFSSNKSSELKKIILQTIEMSNENKFSDYNERLYKFKRTRTYDAWSLKIMNFLAVTNND